MVHIDNLKEKELLIAHYFCGKSRKELTPVEVFEMWNNWFKQDFRINKQPTFKMVNGELVFRKDAKVKKDKNIRKEYNHVFQNIYKWIKRTLNIEEHDKAYFKQELDKERNREYGKVIGLAKPLNVHVMMNTSYNQLARFTLSDYKNRRHTITSGDCDKVIAYLKEIKKTNTVCKKGVE